LGKIYSRMRNCGILILTLAIAIAAVGASGTFVSADPCIAQLSYPTMTTAYSTSSSIQAIVAVSATCTPSSSALTAVGDAYDMSVNNDLGSVNTVLSPVSAGTFNGQLVFNLPSSSLGHNMQVSVSIYNGGAYSPGQFATPLTKTSVTVQVNPTNYQNSYYPSGQYPQYPQYPQQITTVTAFVTQMNQQPMYPGYLGLQNTNNSIQQPFARAPYVGRQNTSWLMGAVVALMIAVSVIVAVVFAVIATRNRQQQWQQQWPPRKINQP
jgi:hypothetical protein